MLSLRHRSIHGPFNKTFDTVDREIILDVLKPIGVFGKKLNLFTFIHFTTDRELLKMKRSQVSKK